MKHKLGGIVLGVVVLALAGNVHAARNQFGVKAGVAIQNLGGSDAEELFGNDLESRTGFAGGVYFQSDFSPNFGIRVEGLYFMKGATAEVDSLAGLELAFKLDYIEFPVLLMAHLPLGDTGRVSFFGGPTVGFNVSSEAELSFEDFSAGIDIGDATSSFEFGLTFGAGLSFQAGSVVLGVDGRYGFGLTSVVDGDADLDNDGFPDFGGDDVDVTNKGFAIMASVGFPLGAE